MLDNSIPPIKGGLRGVLLFRCWIMDIGYWILDGRDLFPPIKGGFRAIGLNVIRIDGYYVLKNITGTLEMITGKIRNLEDKTTP
jgi:hypothetical protein